MQKADAIEATPIMQRSIKTLLWVVENPGADFRSACGQVIANAHALIVLDQAGPPLQQCFDLAWQNGVTQAQLASVRNQMLGEKPVSIGATMIRDSIIHMCVATEGRVIADMVFVSRQDVDILRDSLNTAFATIEENVADSMDAMTFRALVELHAAITNHLVKTARAPLPRIVAFAFAQSMPTLLTAMRLYADAGRADELRAENKTVHPAFMLPTGIGLSS